MGRSRTFLCLLLCLVPACLTIYQFNSIVPFWDSALYARCALELDYQEPMIPLARCGFADPVAAYLIPLWIIVFLSGEASSALYVGNLLLLVVYLYSILVIIRGFIAKNSPTLLDYLLPLAIFVCDPLIITYVLAIAPDFGTTVFSTAYVAAILSGHIFIAMALGLVMLLTKATATTLFALLGSLSLLWLSLQRTNSLKALTKSLGSSFVLVVVLPLAAYWSSIYVFKIFPSSFSLAYLKRACWTKPESVLDLLLTFDFSSPSATNYLFNIFGLNFHWLELLLFLSCLGIGSYKRIFKEQPCEQERRAPRFYLPLTILLLVTAVYTTTRCQHFNNPKYVLATVPFFHLAFLYSTYFADIRSSTRIGLLVVLISLQLVSSVATVDPVSKQFYGTFPFGNASLLSMTSRSGECCGHGRDQLSYNTQHLFIDQITALILKETRATTEAPIVIDEGASFELLDSATANYERCLSRQRPHCRNFFPVLYAQRVVTQKPLEFTYIDFPFIRHEPGGLDFGHEYIRTGTRRFTLGKYYIDTYRYSRKETAPATPNSMGPQRE